MGKLFFNNEKNKIFKNPIVKNSLILFSGQTFSSVINIFISIVVVRKIGYSEFGILSLGITYVNIFNILLNFQSFNAVIKFGHQAIAKKDNQLLKSYLKQAFLQDLITAILAYSLSIVLLDRITIFFNWDQVIKDTILILSLSTLFNITGSVIGLLRLFDKFNYISIVNIIVSLVKLALVMVGYFSEYGFFYYVYVEIISIVLVNILNIIASVKILKDNKLLDFLFIKSKWDIEFLKFNIYNNLVSTLDLPVGEFTKIFINQLLGSAELGIYNILIKVGNLANKLTGPIAVTMFPELSKYIANNKIQKAIKLVNKVVIVSFSIGLVLIISQFLLFPIYSEYVFNGNTNRITVSLYFLYAVFCAAVTSIHQIFIALNYVKFNIPIIITSNIIYILIASPLVKMMGLNGLILALSIQAVIVVVWKIVIIKKYERDDLLSGM